MKLLLALLSESGDISMMRLLSLICVITACIIALHSVIKGSDLNAAAVLCGVFLGVGIGGKALQKISESKSE